MILSWLMKHGGWLWLCCLVILPLAGAATAWLRLWCKAARAARDARSRLGLPARAEALDTLVTLAGRLVAPDGSCTPELAGAGVCVATIARAQSPKDTLATALPEYSVRATRLVLETPDGPVELEGAIEVLAGAREVRQLHGRIRIPERARQALAHDGQFEAPHGLVIRSVGEGALVRVRGMLRQRSAEVRRYRESAVRRALRSDGDSALQVAFEGRGRWSGRPRAVAIVLHAAAGTLLWAVSFLTIPSLLWMVPIRESIALTARSLNPFTRRSALRTYCQVRGRPVECIPRNSAYCGLDPDITDCGRPLPCQPKPHAHSFAGVCGWDTVPIGISYREATRALESAGITVVPDLERIADWEIRFAGKQRSGSLKVDGATGEVTQVFVSHEEHLDYDTTLRRKLALIDRFGEPGKDGPTYGYFAGSGSECMWSNDRVVLKLTMHAFEPGVYSISETWETRKPPDRESRRYRIQ